MRRSAGTLRLVAGVVLLLAVPPAPLARADDVAGSVTEEEFKLRADEVTYFQERDLAEASGNVRVVQEGGRVLTADWLVYNPTTGVGVATGNVRLDDGEGVLVSDFAAVNLNTLVALAKNAELDNPEPAMTVRGETIQRTGVDTFEVQRGRFTTCRCPAEGEKKPWEVEVEHADVEVGGYAVGRNLKFRILDVPVLYLPWVIFPVKTKRQSGFLIPSYTQSNRNGAEIEVPFFWTLGRAAQTTLRPKLISKRGLKGAIDLEYVFGEIGYGEGGLAGLQGDDEVNRDDPDTPFSDNRWAYWLRHEQPLARGARFGTDLKGISDNSYVVDFDDLDDSRNDRFLESSAWSSIARRGLYAGIETSTYDDLQSPNDIDRDDFLLNRLPDVRLAAGQHRLGPLPLRFGLGMRYTNFIQFDRDNVVGRGRRSINDQFFDSGADAVFDEQEPTSTGAVPGVDVHRDNFSSTNRGGSGSEGDGQFQEGELLADDGQRFDIYPHVTMPWRLGMIETLSEVGFRETLYLPDEGDRESREIWTVRFDARTRLANQISLGGRELRHVIEPKLAFAAVSVPSQKRNPLFIPFATRSERLVSGDIRLLTRDPSDRVRDERVLQLQLGNRFFSRAGRMVGELRLGTGWDFFDDDLERVFAQGRIRPRPNWTVAFDVGWDPEENRLDDVSSRLSWLANAGHSVRLRYRYLRDPPQGFEDFRRDDDLFGDASRGFAKINQINLDTFFVVTRNLEFFLNGWQSFERSRSGGEVGIIFLSRCRCWDLLISLEQRTRPDETRFNVEVHLAGFGQRSKVPGHTRRAIRDSDPYGFTY